MKLFPRRDDEEVHHQVKTDLRTSAVEPRDYNVCRRTGAAVCTRQALLDRNANALMLMHVFVHVIEGEG